MSNIAAIARFYKVSNKCHTYSIHQTIGLKILVSAVRFRLRAPFPSIMSLKYANFSKVVIYYRSTLVAHFDDCVDRF